MLYSLELDLRTDLGGLRATRSDLAERFERLRRTITEQRLDPVRGGAGYVRTARASQRRDAWDNLLEEIRAVDGYADFLRPPSAAELTSLGLSGPIVLVNASRFGSHALIVDPDGSLRVVPLGRLTIDDVRLRAFNLLAGTVAGQHGSTGTRTALNGTLTWLWDAVVGPVLDHLGRTADPARGELPRVWWIPTGLLALLPMHAATGPGGRSAIDLVTSSYAPSIRMLARAAARGAVTHAGGDLVVAVRKATGPELAGAEQEGNALAEQIPDAVVVMNEAATRESVLAALNRASRAYFACHHVRDDARPDLSGLLLFDDILTVDDLLRVDLADAEFAYLSACATVVPAADAPDEFTHLAAAFQMAGFRSVVATLWPVRDLIATEFSRLFHDGNGADSATDLAAAARALRGRYPDQPECWAPFLHYGL